jgi:hypothetical protein
MSKARMDGLYMMLLGSLLFVMLGVLLGNMAATPLVDFRGLYFPARCLLQQGDPYKASDVQRTLSAEESKTPNENQSAQVKIHMVTTQNPYPPSTLSISVPFAMLPMGVARMVWMVLIIGSMLLASWLMWDLGAENAPLLSGVLIGFLLANSEALVITGNAAGIAISLCLIAVWCFFRERFIAVGIVCFALSLALKPHDTGLVWLYFLLAGGVHRKRALQTLLATVAITLPVVLWVWHVSPNWVQELRANLAAYSAPGSMNDPGLASTGGHGLGMMVNLQTAISFFRDDPHFYTPITYLVCVPLLLVWAFVTLRFRPSPGNTWRSAWLGLAAIAALTLLPVYHRQQDAKLLLLTVPACAMLWAEERRLGRWALLVTGAGFLLVGDLPWIFFLNLIGHSHLPASWFLWQVVAAVQFLPVPLILLAMGIFYLWVYLSHTSGALENRSLEANCARGSE